MFEVPKRFPLCRVCGQRYDSHRLESVRHHQALTHDPEPVKKMARISELLRKPAKQSEA